MAVTRRDFLRVSAAGLVAASGFPVWRSARAAETGAPLLVVVFLRGGADGLSLVAPVGDPHYAALRGALAVSGGPPLATGFALHPALAPLAPLVEAGRVAAVHCAGAPEATRSHFEAQDRMEIATGARPRLDESGWLARALGPVTEAEPFRQLGFGFSSQASLIGSDALHIGDPRVFRLGGASPAARSALAARYGEPASDPVRQSGARALEAADRLRRVALVGGLGGARRWRDESAAERRMDDAPLGGGRGGPALFLRQAEGLARLDEADLRIEAAALDIDGWDTHVGQIGEGPGAFAQPAGALARGLAELAQRLGGRRTLRVVVITEFGRTVRPNGSRGTDHGRGAALLVLAPDVRGGLQGDWPGLAEKTLFEGRDLPVTTDYRQVLAEVLHAHLGGDVPPGTFPGFAAGRLGLFA